MNKDTYNYKKSIVLLARCYAEQDNEGFKKEIYKIAEHFDNIGRYELSEYLMAQVSMSNDVWTTND